MKQYVFPKSGIGKLSSIFFLILLICFCLPFYLVAYGMGGIPTVLFYLSVFTTVLSILTIIFANRAIKKHLDQSILLKPIRILTIIFAVISIGVFSYYAVFFIMFYITFQSIHW
jgi:hypothetical protein